VNESLAEFRGDSSLETWLYRIATNMSIDRRRSGEYKRLSRETLTGDDIVSNAIYEDVWSRQARDGIEREVIKKAMIDCIADYINQMNENFRNVIVLSSSRRFPTRRSLRYSISRLKTCGSVW
jgi:RNA polymerase sigma-70 factor (ECF subfamily)